MSINADSQSVIRRLRAAESNAPGAIRSFASVTSSMTQHRNTWEENVRMALSRDALTLQSIRKFARKARESFLVPIYLHTVVYVHVDI